MIRATQAHRGPKATRETPARKGPKATQEALGRKDPRATKGTKVILVRMGQVLLLRWNSQLIPALM